MTANAASAGDKSPQLLRRATRKPRAAASAATSSKRCGWRGTISHCTCWAAGVLRQACSHRASSPSRELASSSTGRRLADAGLRVARRSQWGERLPPHNVDVWLGDSLGEMPLYYASAHAALLGASFAPLGGQNLIEAAACACPIVLGPHTFNFAQAAEQACASGAAVRASDMHDGVHQALNWLYDSDALDAAHQAALAFAQAHRGAAQAQAQAIVRVMLQKKYSNP